MSENNNEEKLTLIQKLSKIRQMCEVLTKDAKGFNYKYVSVGEILAKVTAGMKKYSVSLIPSICHDSTESSQIGFKKVKFNPKNGDPYDEPVNEYIVKGNMIYKWIDDITGETLEVPFYLVGSQSDPSQAFGSALTYSLRYFLLTFFQITTLDSASDPDAWRSKQKEAEEMEQQVIASAIISQVDEIIRNNINDENRNELTSLVKSIVRINNRPSAKYSEVTNPEMAAALLDAVKKFFDIKE